MKKKIVCISLDNKDVAKIDKMASLRKVGRSEAVRFLIRSKRLPKPARSRGILNNGI